MPERPEQCAEENFPALCPPSTTSPAERALTANNRVLPLDIAIIDDHEMFRDGLALLFAAVPGVRVIAGASGSDGLLATLQTHQPALLILEPQSAELELSSLIRLIRLHRPRLGIVLLLDKLRDVFLQRLAELKVDGAVCSRRRSPPCGRWSRAPPRDVAPSRPPSGPASRICPGGA